MSNLTKNLLACILLLTSYSKANIPETQAIKLVQNTDLGVPLTNAEAIDIGRELSSNKSIQNIEGSNRQKAIDFIKANIIAVAAKAREALRLREVERAAIAEKVRETLRLREIERAAIAAKETESIRIREAIATSRAGAEMEIPANVSIEWDKISVPLKEIVDKHIKYPLELETYTDTDGWQYHLLVEVTYVEKFGYDRLEFKVLAYNKKALDEFKKAVKLDKVYKMDKLETIVKTTKRNTRRNDMFLLSREAFHPNDDINYTPVTKNVDGKNKSNFLIILGDDGEPL